MAEAAPSPASGYIQAIPIFLASDAEVSGYFRDFRAEIDAITGDCLIVLIAEEVEKGDASGLTSALDSRKARFPGLGFSDLPCLWLEDGAGRTAILRLPHDPPGIRQTIRALADVCRESRDAVVVAKKAGERLEADAAGRYSPINAILRGVAVDKSSERKVAVICGVVFVAIILVVAIFIPSPTRFQYNVFRIVLALAAAGFVSMTPGFIEAKVGNVIRAGGALAVFVIVYFYAPAALQALT